MGPDFQEMALSCNGLFEAVREARNRLNLIEEEHERAVRERSPALRSIGLEYSSAVHSYANAVMAWLGWLSRQ
jgi:hypothetical protein